MRLKRHTGNHRDQVNKLRSGFGFEMDGRIDSGCSVRALGQASSLQPSRPLRNRNWGSTLSSGFHPHLAVVLSDWVLSDGYREVFARISFIASKGRLLAAWLLAAWLGHSAAPLWGVICIWRAVKTMVLFFCALFPNMRGHMIVGTRKGTMALT